MNTHDIDIEPPPPPERMILEGIWAVPVDEVIVYRDACINAAIKANADAKVREALEQAESMLRRGAYICKTLTLKGLLSAYADAIRALAPKEQGDPMDGANLAMMLHQNGQGITPAESLKSQRIDDALRGLQASVAVSSDGAWVSIRREARDAAVKLLQELNTESQGQEEV